MKHRFESAQLQKLQEQQNLIQEWFGPQPTATKFDFLPDPSEEWLNVPSPCTKSIAYLIKYNEKVSDFLLRLSQIESATDVKLLLQKDIKQTRGDLEMMKVEQAKEMEWNSGQHQVQFERAEKFENGLQLLAQSIRESQESWSKDSVDDLVFVKDLEVHAKPASARMFTTDQLLSIIDFKLTNSKLKAKQDSHTTHIQSLISLTDQMQQNHSDLSHQTTIHQMLFNETIAKLKELHNQVQDSIESNQIKLQLQIDNLTQGLSSHRQQHDYLTQDFDQFKQGVGEYQVSVRRTINDLTDTTESRDIQLQHLIESLGQKQDLQTNRLSQDLHRMKLEMGEMIDSQVDLMQSKIKGSLDRAMARFEESISKMDGQNTQVQQLFRDKITGVKLKVSQQLASVDMILQENQKEMRQIAIMLNKFQVQSLQPLSQQDAKQFRLQAQIDHLEQSLRDEIAELKTDNVTTLKQKRFSEVQTLPQIRTHRSSRRNLAEITSPLLSSVGSNDQLFSTVSLLKNQTFQAAQLSQRQLPQRMEV